MKLIKTKSFELAVNEVGDRSAKELAILLPGRLDTKDYANFVSHQKFLASKGLFTVCLDPPGTWESPGSIKLFTTTNYIKAVNELIEYYGKRPTLLLGHSRGGNVAIESSTNSHIIGIILVMSSYESPTPPENIVNGFQIEHRDIPPGSERTREQKEFAMPMDYFEDGKQYDPMAILKKCVKPKLMFSGSEDKYYTPKEIEEIYNAIPGPKMLYELNTDHSYRRHPDVIKEVEKVIGEFLDKYLE